MRREIRWLVVVWVSGWVGCGDDTAASEDAGRPDGSQSDMAAIGGDDMGRDGSEPLDRCTADEQCPPATTACAVSFCDRTFGRCVITGPDADADGHADATCDPGPGGTRGDDCDDANPRRFGGGREVCDAADLDEDCDALTYGELDVDGDGSFDGRCCNVDVEHGDERICGGDCDDTNENVRPNDIADGPLMNCDTFDNDCDGSVDEGCTCAAGDERPCGGGMANDSPSVCRQGVQRCGVSGWGECVGSIGPVTELCDRDRLDEDCDGEPNEGCACDDGAERPCGGGPVNGGSSICVLGTERCLGGIWGTCIGSMGPLPAESCDAVPLDEDCDGETNEGCACTDGAEMPCGGGPVNHDTFAMSICQRGTQRCTSGIFGACVGSTAPGTEQCAADGLDEDCDGAANEGCVCTDGQTRACGGGPVNGGTSICVEGTETCVGGTWGTCVGGVGPATETCDETRRDEDCNGMQNEGCGIVQVAVSAATTCVLRQNGRIACWGDFTGDADPTTTTLRPVEPPTVLPAVELAASSSSNTGRYCARLTDGSVVCGTPAALIPVSGVSGATSVAAGAAHACALLGDGTVLCWGDNRSYQCGSTMVTSTLPPTLVAGLSDAVQIATGTSHSCARRATGAVVCWGSNRFGQLADGGGGPGMPGNPTPTSAMGVDGAVDLCAGADFVCTRQVDQPPTCWGYNTFGALGRGTSSDFEPPGAVAVPSGTAIARMSCGLWRGCAGASNTYCWGFGPIGEGSTDLSFPTPRLVPALGSALAVAPGTDHGCALFGPDRVACWGRNDLGQLGTGAVGPTQYTPVDAVYVPE